MKLTQVTKLDKKNTRTSKNIDDDEKSDVTVFLKSYDRFLARKPDSECMMYKIYIFINNIPLSYRMRKLN